MMPSILSLEQYASFIRDEREAEAERERALRQLRPGHRPSKTTTEEHACESQAFRCACWVEA
jgi:hypothetical protein